MSIRSRLACLGCSLLSVFALGHSAQAQCLDWKPGFGAPIIGTDGPVRAQLVFDDGSGPALYAGGTFSSAGGGTTQSVARFRGSTWSALGFGPGGSVRALASFDSGTGPRLYAVGEFSSVDRWTGTSWSSVGFALQGSPAQAYALASFDDGSGAALYVGGGFNAIGSVPANNIVRWNGSSWSAVGGGVGVQVKALTVFDDGSGPALYAGGATQVLKWNGVAWSVIGTGMGVSALAVFDDGSGPALYAGGASNVFKWNGASWQGLTGGGTNNTVDALQVWNGPGGPALLVGGSFTTAGGQPANHVALWNGSSWQALGSGLVGSSQPDTYSLAVFDDGSGPRVYAGGRFTNSGTTLVNNIARWDGSSWSSLGPTGAGLDANVYALAVHDDGSGPALYAGGAFTQAGSTPAASIAKWNGSSWSPLGAGVSGVPTFVSALAVFDAGSGLKLYAGGSFAQPGAHIVRWDGASLSPVAGGLDENVFALTGYNGPGIPGLYAGGVFGNAGGNPVPYIARYNGASWSALGTGMDNTVYALTIFDDGSGPALFAGGLFTNAGGTSASAIAKWNGTSWSAVGGGLSGGNFPSCQALAVYDDGAGPALFAGGYFYSAGGNPASFIAKWNGSNWSAVGGGLDGYVDALTTFDDGAGPALYVGGGFNMASGVFARHIARWNGATWSAIGDGANGTVRALAVFDDGSGGSADLYVGGEFTSAGLQASRYIAEYRGCTGPGTLFCLGDGTGVACPCLHSGQLGHGCQNSALTGGSQLSASGSTAPDTVVLMATGELSSALTIVLQGNAQIAPTPFGDGLRCAGGSLRRLYIKSAVAGAVAAPQAGDPSITTRSAALGDPIVSGSTRYYQTYYRDPVTTYCAPPFGDNWNASNGVRILW